jgi:hypothetical protein
MFKEISAKENDDGFIDKKEFMAALDLTVINFFYI